MNRFPLAMAIDARPCGPNGLLAVEPLLGRTVLDHALDQVVQLAGTNSPVSVCVRPGDREAILDQLRDRPRNCVDLVERLPDTQPVLRTDRLYDTRRLRRVLRSGADLERAVIWRLDTALGLAGAADELLRRRTFQPLGHYWALGPARWLARTLAPTPVRPNAVTLLASAFFLAGSAFVGFGGGGLPVRLAAAFGLAVALVLDTADGHLARLQGTATAFGRWLDGWLDEVGEMALHAAIAWSTYVATGHVGWLLVGMFYGMGKFVFVVGNAPVETTSDVSLRKPALPARQGLIVTFVRLAGHADVRWHLWIVLAAVGRLELGLLVYTAYYPARALAGALRKGVRGG